MMTTSTPTAAPASNQRSAGRAITVVWIALSAITIGTWWLAPGHTTSTDAPSVPITVAVVALGFIKCRLIIQYFMEIRTAPTWLKLSTDAWLIVLWGAVLGIYLV
jgi:hypothetical protein